MPTSPVDSVVFRDIFVTEPMRRVWSDGNRTLRYLDNRSRARACRCNACTSCSRQSTASPRQTLGEGRCRRRVKPKGESDADLRLQRRYRAWRSLR
jgi:hypothetical protein